MRSSTYASATSRGSGLFVDMPTSSTTRTGAASARSTGHGAAISLILPGSGPGTRRRATAGRRNSGPQSHCWKINRVSTRATDLAPGRELVEDQPLQVGHVRDGYEDEVVVGPGEMEDGPGTPAAP